MPDIRQEKVHLFDIANGALMEEVSVQLQRVQENLYDPNTPWKPTRKLTVELEMCIDEHREIVDVQAKTTVKLAPSKPVKTRLTFGKEGARELSMHTPGQISLDGSVVPHPALIAVGGGKSKDTHTEERIESHG